MIDEQDIARLKEIFVTRQECQTDMNAFDEKLTKDFVKLAVIETKLKVIIWLLCAVGTAVIANIIQGILK